MPKSGYYQVIVKFRADSQSGNVTYTLYNGNDESLACVTVDQNSSAPAWCYAVLDSKALLTDGCYVRASDIASGTNVDAVKFKFIEESE